MTMLTSSNANTDATPFTARAGAPAGPATLGAARRRAVVVHGGARDAYQLALALAEVGLLELLVTDLFWTEESGWRKALSVTLPKRWRTLLQQRSAKGLPSGKVQTHLLAGLAGLMIDRLHSVPFAMRRWCTRSADAALGHAAGVEARQKRTGLVSYSYFGFDAFTAYGRGGILFQAHPHPATMRRILRQELRDHPDCAGSLTREWELALPERDFEHLAREVSMASHYLAASSFTRASLVENGIPRSAIHVVPYGVDLHRFRPDVNKPRSRTPKLRLLFVGRINQRKGLKYLLEALRLLPKRYIDLMICGRVIDGLDMFSSFSSQVEVRASVSGKDLMRAYQSADLFVFPSVGEGFGQVLLESLASGLPILSTTSTAAPDLIDDGQQGFIVEPRRSDQLAERIDWALNHRAELEGMGVLARERAEQFTWQRFRTSVAQVVDQWLNESPETMHEDLLLKRGAA